VSALPEIGVGLIPVFAFLVVLVFLDSFKLLKPRSILQGILVGCGVALLSLVINKSIIGSRLVDVTTYSRTLAPVVEEALKALYVIYMIRTRKVGFVVDAAIIGFAVGAGFAFIENVYYFQVLGGSHLAVWIIRGFGTAVMHGGTTALFAVVSKTLSERHGSENALVFFPGLVAAVAIHMFFNQFWLPPMVNTVVQLVALPALLALAFAQSERSLRDWLEVGLDTDVRLLEDITTGSVSETRVGKYLGSLKGRFPGQVVGDMLCMLRIHLELAIRAKGILMMREAGFKAPCDPEIEERFAELRYLEKSLGKTGWLAIAPVLHNTSRDLWQIYMLESEKDWGGNGV
jgi:RsiW-degrading membrane proteinase PrsW (M82 family)